MEEGFTTERLLVAVARRDADAFRRLYDQTSAQLYAITRCICVEDAVADEALEETYAAVWRRALAFDAKRQSGMAWLAAIARNRALSLRRRRNVTVSPTGVYAAEATQLPDLHGARRADPDLDVLVDSLESVDPLARDAILHSYFHGWDRSALAKRLETPTSTLRPALRKAVGKLSSGLDR